jgi:NAD(P)-dependent dehydrogenase (short-subunit alcohol dehydrogenase family)
MKNYLVIGASSGIGKAVAERLSSEANVWATFCSNELEKPAMFTNVQQLNVLNSPDLELPDVLDGLVYCPGAINLKPFKRITADQMLEDWHLQVGGAVHCIQQALHALKKSDAPSVVLFSTVAVQKGFNFHSLVAMSKGALEGLVRSLAAEYAPSIRFNAIAPSLTDTPLASSLLNTEAKVTANGQRHPLKRIGKSDDIAAATCFLLTEESSWITGQVLHVDGGISTLVQ